MTGPFPDVTVLNSPRCDLPAPTPGSRSADCVVNATLPSALACAAACAAANASCTAYTWHDATQGEWALACVFRTDGAWEPLPGAVGHTSGQHVNTPPLVWPVNDGFSRLPVMWFGANSSGLDSDDTLALIARHRVGGYGWQQGTGTLPPGGNLGHGEVLLAEAATHLHDYLAAHANATGPPTPLVFVYRQIQVALRLFAAPLAAADNAADDGFWLRAGATVCQAAQPWGTLDPHWNFSAPAAAAYWAEAVIGELAAERDVMQAVFFDESDQGFCGYWATAQGNCPALPAAVLEPMQAANNGVLARTTAALNAAGIIPLFSLLNRFAAAGAGVAAPPPCALPEDATAAAIGPGAVWARFYENWPNSYWDAAPPADVRAAQIANAILEGAAGIPALIHAPAGDCPDTRVVTRPGRLGGTLEPFLAAFLIVQTPQTVFSASKNWYDADFCWHPEFDVTYGSPLGPAVRVGPYKFARNFTGCTVSVDTSAGTGTVYLL